MRNGMLRINGTKFTLDDASEMATRAIRRAKERNLPCAAHNELVAWIAQNMPSHCPALGCELKRGRGNMQRNSPSLDRKIPSLGYVAGNLAILSEAANRIKGDHAIEDLQLVCKYLETN